MCMVSELTFNHLADIFIQIDVEHHRQCIQNSSDLPPVWSDVQELITCRATSGWLKSIWCGMLWKALDRLRLNIFSRIIFRSTMTPLATSTPSSLARSL